MWENKNDAQTGLWQSHWFDLNEPPTSFLPNHPGVAKDRKLHPEMLERLPFQETNV